MVYYFAYGSNMDPARLEERSVSFEVRIPAVLPGYRLVFNKRRERRPLQAAANVVPSEGRRVEGALYGITADALLKLDVFEGYPVQYSRESMTVWAEGETISDAWVYVAQLPYIREDLRPSGAYLQHLLAASDLLSDPYLEELRQIHTIEEC